MKEKSIYGLDYMKTYDMVDILGISNHVVVIGR